MLDSRLIQKYNVAAPRYTSYPTVPYWATAAMDPGDWGQAVGAAFEQDSAISLYLHLPYCEKLCTYCGCNKRITRNHGVVMPYIQSLLQEWALYTQQLPQRPLIRELHLGGGTPTFFSPAELRFLIEGILASADLAPTCELGFEAHPFSTTYEHLATLRTLGFSRISVGVQDFDPAILAIINRQQTSEQVVAVNTWAQELGYTSINYDLIFGLPLQTPEHIHRTMDQIGHLAPTRIAFYSYAHVPWIKPSQRAYSEADLPQGSAKRVLYEIGRERLEALGYVEIGMDHFALPSDGLYRALETGQLHRNFMGYTPLYTRLSLALGASSIGDAWTGFAQNEKNIEAYQAQVAAGQLPLTRGHWLSAEDQILRTHILNLMCRFETSWTDPALQTPGLWAGLERLEDLEADGLVQRELNHLQVTEIGRAFLRNICLAFDAHFWAQQPTAPLFSQAV